MLIIRHKYVGLGCLSQQNSAYIQTTRKQEITQNEQA